MTHSERNSEPAAWPQALDPDQLEAVRYRGGNLLIVAGAGSGKTRALTYRALSFLDDMQPENLMLVTFTKKAAHELLTRMAAGAPTAAHSALKRAWIGTIHSICWRMLMESGHRVDLQPNWSVLDMADSQRVMAIAGRPFGFTETQAKSVYQLYSYARNSMTDWKQWVRSQRFPEVPGPAAVGQAIESYRRRCCRSNRVDFDDLQVLALQLLEANPDVRSAYQERFRLIMVDEYQDTSRIQAKLLSLLAAACNTVTVVGDDAQAIYGFRAATVDNILEFEQVFRARRITIGTNYRSTPEIVALANASIRHNRRQIFKEIASDRPAGTKPLLFSGVSPTQEARFVLGRVQENLRRGIPIEQQAVLFRATRLAAALELELKAAGIPYVVVGGEDFFTLEHVKLVMDMARLLVNPEDAIALGAIQELMGWGSAIALYDVEQQADQRQLSFWQAAQGALSAAAPASRTQYEAMVAFRADLDRLRHLVVEGQPITPVLSKVVEYLLPYLKRRFSGKWDDVMGDLAILNTVAAQYVSVPDFVNTVALQQFMEDRESTAGKLTLSTIHSAKGLEWQAVFVIGLVEFWFPLNLAIQQQGTDEEERRLFYVAVTRAKSDLCLSTYTQAVNPYGKTLTQYLSRFIQELPASVYSRL